jgi:RNA polymerase sigma factor (sigma-70 family)
MRPPTFTDADAIERSLVEPAAFAAIFDRHYDAVHAFAVRRAGRVDGEEIAADVFLRAFDRRRRYDLSYVDARPWLLGIASNVLRRRWRTDRRRLAAVARLPRDRALETAAAPQLEADVADALGRLSARDREALLLYAWGDLSYDEISRALGVPVGTVRSRLARARSTLREALVGTSVPELSFAGEGTSV